MVLTEITIDLFKIIVYIKNNLTETTKALGT